MIQDRYTTIAYPTEGTFRDRGSKFIGYAFPVSNEKEIKEHLQHLKKIHPSAGHVCYAFRINPLNEYWRANDDGEPSSSAGKPILGQIRSMELQNILVAVVRYFGGTLLGVPGLIHAYKTATSLALQLAPIIQKSVEVEYVLNFDYQLMNEVMMVVKQYQCSVIEQSASLFVRLKIGVPKARLEEVIHKFNDLQGVTYSIEL
jgi:uncharacterized YigZ family protein